MAIENNNYGWQVMHSALGDAYTVLYKALMYDCKIPHSELERITSVLETALKVKERNCDVGTVEKQGERFQNFCRTHQFISVDSEDGFPPVYVCSNESCPLHDYYIARGEDNCELAWAQMPYTEEKGN